MSVHSFCLAPAFFHHRPCGQLIVIAQLLKICPLGFTEVKGLTPGSEPVFMSLATKGFVMNREPQETKAFSKDKQLCSIHQHLHSLPPSLVKTHFLTEIMWDWGGAKSTTAFRVSKDKRWKQEKIDPLIISPHVDTEKRNLASPCTKRLLACIIMWLSDINTIIQRVSCKLDVGFIFLERKERFLHL